MYVTNFKDPWQHIINLTETEKINAVGNFTNRGNNIYNVSNDLTLQKKALQYTITKLQENDISVIIINMPLNPYYTTTINESNRYILSNFLNSTGVQWYDFENEYSSEYFTDTGHLNVAGRTDFSPKVATIITNNLLIGD